MVGAVGAVGVVGAVGDSPRLTYSAIADNPEGGQAGKRWWKVRWGASRTGRWWELWELWEGWELWELWEG